MPGTLMAPRASASTIQPAYAALMQRKSQLTEHHGFAPVWMPDALFPFQQSLAEWACLKGRGAIFASCGLGKTAVQLTVAENIVRQTNKNVLVVTPLAVSQQTIAEGEKFGIACVRSQDGRVAGKITVTNYERLQHFDPTDYV